MTQTELISRIQGALTPDLLKKGYGGVHPYAGHCYAASEALYHALGGAKSSWYPVRARDEKEVTHWWLENEQGDILDPTSVQYTSQGLTPPYSFGKRGGFLTRLPSKRANKILQRIGVEV